MSTAALVDEIARLRAENADLRRAIESNAESYRLALDQQNAENCAALEEARRALAAEQERSARLIQPVMASAHLIAGDRRAPLWSLVAEIFAVGSTRAESMCRDHGYDPDQEVTRRRAPKPTADKALQEKR